MANGDRCVIPLCQNIIKFGGTVCKKHANRKSKHGSYNERPKPEYYCYRHGERTVDQVFFFNATIRGKEERKYRCIECNDANQFKTRHGLTIQEFEVMSFLQKGVCAICKKPETSKRRNSLGIKRLSVDHDHHTRKVRELLCFRCNTVLGRIQDSIDIAQSMLDYLKKHTIV